jgi:hypothetical protein
VRELRTGATRRIPFVTDQPLGTPPELVLNWSPDGRRIAVLTTKLPAAGSSGVPRETRLVDVATARSVASQPAVLPTARTLTAPTAPAFLRAGTLAFDANCCIGAQRLETAEVGSARHAAFATVSSPAVAIGSWKPGRLLVVTALHELALVSAGHTDVVARGIQAAAG